jgi:hypothetical protein
VHTIQKLPAAAPRNTDATLAAIVKPPVVAGRTAGPAGAPNNGRR